MLYDNTYNRDLAKQLHLISQRYVDHAKFVGGAILGGTVPEVSDSESDSDHDNYEGGNGFAQGTHLDTGFGPTLGASPLDKVTKATILKEAKLAQGGKKLEINTSHQNLMGGPQMGLGKREGKGFWDDLKAAGPDILDSVAKTAAAVAPIIPIVKAIAGKKKGKGASGGHALVPKAQLPSSSMGQGKKGRKGKGFFGDLAKGFKKGFDATMDTAGKVASVVGPALPVVLPVVKALAGKGKKKRDVAQAIADAQTAFNVPTPPINLPEVSPATSESSTERVVGGALPAFFDKFKPILKYLSDYAVRKGMNLKLSDFKDLSKEKVFKTIASEIISELPNLIKLAKGGGMKDMKKHYKGSGFLSSIAPLVKFAPLLLGLGKKGKGVYSDVQKGKYKIEGSGPALDKGPIEEIENLPPAQAGKGKKKGKGILSSLLSDVGLGKPKKGGLLPQETLTKKGKGKKKEKEAKEEKKEEEAKVEGGKKKASEWAKLVKKVMGEQKMSRMADAIAYIKKHNLYKKKK